jgi:hypothetical protein
MEKHLLIVACFLISLISGQTTLTSGTQVTGYISGYSSSCYALYVSSGDTVTVEVTATTSSANLQLATYSSSAVCNSTAYYTYQTSTAVDGNRYTLTFKASSYGYQYFSVYNSGYYGSYITIKASTDGGGSSGNYIALNTTYYGYAPSYGGSTYVKYYFYSTSDAFEIDISGYYSYFYLKKGSYASSSSYDLYYYSSSTIVSQNTVDPCSSSSSVSGAGWWYVAISSYYASSYPFTFKIVPKSGTSSSATTLSTGTSSVTLNYGYNYFQVYAYSTQGLQLNITDSAANSYYIQTGAATKTGCVPSYWSLSTSLSSSSPSWVWFPTTTGYQTIGIYNYKSYAVSVSIDLEILYSYTYSALPLTSQQSTVVSVAYSSQMVYFAYKVTDNLPFTIGLSNYMYVYVKQGSLPTDADYDYFPSYASNSNSYTIDPCTYTNYQDGVTIYIGVTYYTTVSAVISVSEDYQSSCNTPYPPIGSSGSDPSSYTYHSHSDIALIVGSIFGGVAVCSCFIFAIGYSCQKKKKQYAAVPPAHKFVQLETYSENHGQPSFVPMYAQGPMPYMPMPMPPANGNGYPMMQPMYAVPQNGNNPYMPPAYAMPVMPAPIVQQNTQTTTPVTKQ